MMSRTKALILCVALPILLLVLSFVCWPHFGTALRVVWIAASSLVCFLEYVLVAYIKRRDQEVCAELMGQLHESMVMPWDEPQYEAPVSQPSRLNEPSVSLQTVMVWNDLNHKLITQEEADRRIRQIHIKALGLRVVKGGKE